MIFNLKKWAFLVAALGCTEVFTVPIQCAQAATAASIRTRQGDIPAAAIRSDIAKRFHCRWEMRKDSNFPENSGLCWISNRSRLYLMMSTDDHDRFSYIEYHFSTRLQYEGGASKKEKVHNKALIHHEMKGAVWLLRYFLPQWKNSAQWLKRAAKDSLDYDSYDSKMVGDIGVAVRDNSPADRDDTNVLLGITQGDPSQWRRPN